MDPNASGGLTPEKSLNDRLMEYKNYYNPNPKNVLPLANELQIKIDPGNKFGKYFGIQSGGSFLDPAGIITGLFGSSTKKKWYRDYRKWAKYWREGTEEAMGYGKGPATDPLAQLQTALMGKVDMNQIQNGYSQGYDPSGLVGAQNKAMAATLNQRAAGMGVGGAYDAVMNASNSSRQTLINQAMAAYRPQAYEAQQQLTQNSDQLLQAIQQANLEAQKSLAASGRSYG